MTARQRVLATVIRVALAGDPQAKRAGMGLLSKLTGGNDMGMGMAAKAISAMPGRAMNMVSNLIPGMRPSGGTGMSAIKNLPTAGRPAAPKPSVTTPAVPKANAGGLPGHDWRNFAGRDRWVGSTISGGRPATTPAPSMAPPKPAVPTPTVKPPQAGGGLGGFVPYGQNGKPTTFGPSQGQVFGKRGQAPEVDPVLRGLVVMGWAGKLAHTEVPAGSADITVASPDSGPPPSPVLMSRERHLTEMPFDQLQKAYRIRQEAVRQQHRDTLLKSRQALREMELADGGASSNLYRSSAPFKPSPLQQQQQQVVAPPVVARSPSPILTSLPSPQLPAPPPPMSPLPKRKAF